MGSVSLILKPVTGYNPESVPFTNKIHLKVILSAPTQSSKHLLSKRLCHQNVACNYLSHSQLMLAQKVPRLAVSSMGHTCFRSVLKILIYESNISSNRSSIRY
jgi:hypothetical protein